MRWSYLREKKSILENERCTGEKKVYSLFDGYLSLQPSPSPKSSIYSCITLADCDCFVCTELLDRSNEAFRTVLKSPPIIVVELSDRLDSKEKIV